MMRYAVAFFVIALAAANIENLVLAWRLHIVANRSPLRGTRPTPWRPCLSTDTPNRRQLAWWTHGSMRTWFHRGDIT
jgi:hypothetical protein